MALTSFSLAAADDWANFARYSQENAQVRQLPDSCRRVVFMGNSITQNWNTEHPGFFKDNGFVCRGISGQTTYNMLSRFRNDVVGLKPQIVVIGAGTNDVAENSHPFDLETTAGNIFSMAEIARANGIKVIVTSVLPCESYYWHQHITDIPEKIKALNARVERYCNENGIPFVDFYTLMLAPDGKGINPAYCVDGVHPVADAYNMLEELILKTIEPMLQ